MTVKELIRVLGKFSPELEVEMYSEWYDGVLDAGMVFLDSRGGVLISNEYWVKKEHGK